MPHQHRNDWYDKRALPREPADYPESMEALLAQEQHRWRESPEPEQPAAHRGGFSLPAEGGPNGSSIAV